MITKAISIVLVLNLARHLFQDFYFGFLSGVAATLVIQYYYFIRFLQRKHVNEKISFSFQLSELHHLLQNSEVFMKSDKKKKHFINKYSKTFENQNQKKEPTSESNLEIVRTESIENKISVEKMHHSKFTKKIEIYTYFNDQIRELQIQLGTSLMEFKTSHSVLTQLEKPMSVDITSKDQITLITQITEAEYPVNSKLHLPSWSQLRQFFNQMGYFHIELSKQLCQSIGDQINLLKKESGCEWEKIKKEKKKIFVEYSESESHLLKTKADEAALDRELKQAMQMYNGMSKKREDPQAIIKQEMKVKLLLQNQDSMRLKVEDAKERQREMSMSLKQLNDRILKHNLYWEEQRMVFFKQGLQNQLLGFEDLSHQVQQLVAHLIVVVKEEAASVSSPREVLESEEIQELPYQEQIHLYIKYTNETLNKWGLIQKHDEEMEQFFGHLKGSFERYFSQMQFDNKQIDCLWDSNYQKNESMKIIVRSIFQGICGLKNIYKQLAEQMERRRAQLHRMKVDVYSLGKELESQCTKHIKRLEQFSREEYQMLKYKHEEDDNKGDVIEKGKMRALHFFSEVKQNVKNIHSIGNFVSTVGSAVNKVHKMNQMTDEEYRERQKNMEKESATYLSLIKFSMSGLDEILNKHQKFVQKEKVNFLLDVCLFSINLTSNFRKTIDEMSQKIQKEQQRQYEESKKEEEKQNLKKDVEKEQIEHKKEEKKEEKKKEEEKKEEELTVKEELTKEALDVNWIQKLVRVFYAEWRVNQSFKSKLTKVLSRSFNKKRPALLDVILVEDLRFDGDLPNIISFESLQQEDQEFLADIEFSLRGTIMFSLSTKILINWPKMQVPVNAVIVIKNIHGKLRMCFVPETLGKSWISFIGQPVLGLGIEPKVASYNLGNLGSVSEILSELVLNKVKLITFPNKQTVEIPITKKAKKIKKQMNQ